MQENKASSNINIELLSELKHDLSNSGVHHQIPVIEKGETVAVLRPVSSKMINEKKECVELLTKWRAENWNSYPTVFKVTLEGTYKWVQSQLIDREDRILFMIETIDGRMVGHLGLSNYDLEKNEAEIDNVVRGGQDALPGIMTLALNTLSSWAFETQGLGRLFLRVFSENERALSLYKRCGFKAIKEIPLHKTVEGDVIRYDEIQMGEMLSVDRMFVLMERVDSVQVACPA